MQFKMTIDMDNAAFEDDPLGELARMLSKVQVMLTREGPLEPGNDLRFTLRDVNGNTVGEAVTRETPFEGEIKPERTQFTVGEIRRALSEIPAYMKVHLGICDDDFGKDGGVFAPAEEIQAYGGDAIQISAWKDITK